MAHSPIAFIAPNYRDYKNWWLKAYEPGTTTPKSMSDNDTGSPSVAKYEINKDGFIESSGETLVIPHIDGDYDLWLFPTEEEADNNDTTNAERLADDISPPLFESEVPDLIGGYVCYEFITTQDAKDGICANGEQVTLEVDDVIRIKDRDSSLFDVIDGTLTANDLDIIAHDTLDLSYQLRYPDTGVTLSSMGAVSGDSVDDIIDRITSLSLTVIVPVGRFHITRGDNREDNPTIIGVKMPTYQDGFSQLEGGSILVGTLELKGKNPTVKNIGIDHGIAEFPADRNDALVLAHENPFTAISMATVENVVALVAEPEDPYHALLIEGHYDTNITNVVGINGFFGTALKNTRNNLVNGTFINNGSDSIIVKSDTTSGRVKDVNISNVICDGAGTTGDDTTSFSIRISAFDNDVDSVNISNVVSRDASYAIYLDASAADAGLMNSVNISNVIGRDMGRGILIDGGSGAGLINNIAMSELSFDETEFRAAEIKGNVGRVKIDNFFNSNIANSTLLDSTFQVLSTVAKLELTNIQLIEDNNQTIKGTLNLTNPAENNQLGGVNNLNIGGVGIPKPGYSTDGSTGTSITLTPEYNSKNQALIEMNASGTRTVISITRDMVSGTRYPTGYILRILNNASGVITIDHDPALYIYNRGSVDFDIQPNEIASYMFGGSVWHQIGG